MRQQQADEVRKALAHAAAAATVMAPVASRRTEKEMQQACRSMHIVQSRGEPVMGRWGEGLLVVVLLPSWRGLRRGSSNVVKQRCCAC